MTNKLTKAQKERRIEFAQKFIYFAKRFGTQNNWTVENDLLDWYEQKRADELATQKKKMVKKLENMVIEEVGNSSKTLDQAIETIK